MDAESIPAEALALLREVHAATDGCEPGSDADGSESAGAGFGSQQWMAKFKKIADYEDSAVLSSQLGQHFSKAMMAAAPLLEEPLGSVEEGHSAGPYQLAAFLTDRGVAIDLDAYQSPMNRALRRQQWAALAP